MENLLINVLGKSTKNIIALSIVNETIISELKKVVKVGNINWERVSIGTGMAFSVVFGQNLFRELGFSVVLHGLSEKTAIILTTLLTGFLISRGSNIIYKSISLLNMKRSELKLQI